MTLRRPSALCTEAPAAPTAASTPQQPLQQRRLRKRSRRCASRAPPAACRASTTRPRTGPAQSGPGTDSPFPLPLAPGPPTPSAREMLCAAVRGANEAEATPAPCDPNRHRTARPGRRPWIGVVDGFAAPPAVHPPKRAHGRASVVRLTTAPADANSGTRGLEQQVATETLPANSTGWKKRVDM